MVVWTYEHERAWITLHSAARVARLNSKANVLRAGKIKKKKNESSISIARSVVWFHWFTRPLKNHGGARFQRGGTIAVFPYDKVLSIQGGRVWLKITRRQSIRRARWRHGNILWYFANGRVRRRAEKQNKTCVRSPKHIVNSLCSIWKKKKKFDFYTIST